MHNSQCSDFGLLLLAEIIFTAIMSDLKERKLFSVNWKINTLAEVCVSVHAALAVCHIGSLLKIKKNAVVKTRELIIVVVCISFDREAVLVEEALCGDESRREFHSL